MTDEELISSDLTRSVRVMATIGGQIAERLARLRSDAARQQQLEAQERTRAAADEARNLDRRMQQEIAAARTGYAGVRNPEFWRDDDRHQVRVGEALVVSEAMRPHDPLAGIAHDHLRREINHRHGDNADAWILAATAAYREELDRLHDHDTAHTEADHHTQNVDTAQRASGDAEAERERAAEEPDQTSDEDLWAQIAAEQRQIAEAETASAWASRAEEDVSVREAERADTTARELRANDPEAAQAKDVTEPGYPIPDRDNINRRGRSRKAARSATAADAERTSGR